MQEELYCGKNKFDDLETDAYIELAGVLVSHSRSFCREDQHAMPSEISLNLVVKLEGADLRWLTTLASMEKRKNVRIVLGETILDRLPRGRVYVYQNYYKEFLRNYAETAKSLVRLAIEWLKYNDGLAGRDALEGETATLAVQKLGGLRRDRALVNAIILDVDQPTAELLVWVEKTQSWSLSGAFYRKLENTRALVVGAMQLLEREDRWGEFYDMRRQEMEHMKDIEKETLINRENDDL